MVGFEKQSCESCNNFRPYVILKNSGRIVYAIGSPIVVSYIPFLYFGYLDGDSSSNIASAEDESANNTHSNTNGNIEINSTVLGVNDPLLYLLSGYVKTKKKLTDIREKYGSTTSLVVSLFPGVGEGYDIITLLKGKDPITGEKLTTIAKGFTIIGLLSGIGSGKLARDAAELAVQKIAKELGVTVDEVKTIAKSILDEYDLSNIEDLIALKNRFTKDGKLSLDEFWKVVKTKVWKVKADKIIGKLNYEKKIADQMLERVWNNNLMENIIRSPKKIGKSINNYNGANNPATVFYNSNFEYIVIDDITGAVVQVSNRTDKNWVVDARIYNLNDF